MTSLPFTKMQALGNDFVIVAENDLLSAAPDALANGESVLGSLAVVLCDRHFGVGADGFIVACKSDRDNCLIGWRYINSDGSPAKMCGNGLRCLALYAVQEGLVDCFQFAIATAVGPVKVDYVDADHINIDLGAPILDSELIPIIGTARSPVVGETVSALGTFQLATCLSMGNPHCVIFEPKIALNQYSAWANALQSTGQFPEGVNVEFACVLDRKLVRVFVWERGCGPTLACASGAAAVVVAGVMEKRIDRIVNVELPGGNLNVEWSCTNNHVYLTGMARRTFDGVVDMSVWLDRKKIDGTSFTTTTRFNS